MPTGESPKDPIESGGVDYRHKWCRCSVCGCIAKATPRFDFYTAQEDGGPTGPLRCERCVMTDRRKS